MTLWWFNAATLAVSLTPGGAFHLFHPTLLPSSGVRPPALVHEVHDTSTSDRRWAVPTAAAAVASEETPPRGSRSTAATKERFLRNLERRRAGDDVSSSVLDVDLGLLSTTTASSAGGTRDSTATTVEDLGSWRGKWEICYAPHIETLGKVILMNFPSVEYNFVSGDGRMVSHSRYESKVFGSGWFNADGRVVLVPPSASDGAGEGRRDVVKVIFERFWWDRNAEERPTETPPGAAEGETDAGGVSALDWFVQAAGKAMFFDGLSVFPVLYLDDDFCIFKFEAAGTVVASSRVST
ncbi:unnamed protein product [Scytosiphon promiscuus]